MTNIEATNNLTFAMLAGIIAYSTGAKAQGVTLSVIPQSGMPMLLVSTVNTYSLNGVIGAKCNMITFAQLIGNPGDTVSFGTKPFSTPQNPVLISQTLTGANFLNTGDWTIVAYDEWQKPSYEYNTPQVSEIGTSVSVQY